MTRLHFNHPAAKPLQPTPTQVQLMWVTRQRITSQSTNVGSVAAPKLQTSSYQYDKAGQLIKLAQADGSYWGYSYDEAHRLVGLNDHLGNKVVYTLDNAGHRIKETYQDPKGVLKRGLQRAFDALGRVMRLQ